MSKELTKLITDAAKKLQSLDFGEAIKIYERAVKLSPGNAAAELGLAIAYNRIGKSAQALPILQKLWAATQKPKVKITHATQAEILAQVGLAFVQLGQPEQALGAYKLAQGLYPSAAIESQINALSNLMQAATPLAQLLHSGQVQLRLGKLDQAIQCFRAAVQLAPDNDEALHALGDALRVAGDAQNAMICIQQAIVMQPEVAEYHNTLGMLFQQRGEFAQAAKMHQRAIKLNPKLAFAMCNLGVALRHLNRREDALKAYQAALKIDPKLAQAHNNMGNVLRDLGDAVGAKKAFQTALAIAPGYADAQNNLASLAAPAIKKATTPAKRASKPVQTTGKKQKMAPKSAANTKAAPKKAAAKGASKKKVVTPKSGTKSGTKSTSRAPAGRSKKVGAAKRK